MMSGLQDVTHPLAALRARIIHLYQLPESQYGVQWGTQFVTHRGEELRLGCVGPFGFRSRGEHGVFGGLALGNVFDDADHSAGVAVVVEDRKRIATDPPLDTAG